MERERQIMRSAYRKRESDHRDRESLIIERERQILCSLYKERESDHRERDS